ncbi:uncharacterized protein TA18205 [Theileria annulata]|uniref:Uncharacterized protein n=1 Tax=Theileria annulata TaxID=5874 RepID=Q4UB11_THEAN|nr:uncharacterized protein TA18205 [Theileria annulata]CAI75990.1 hypothetical protein TA18205 [Theileria annulata]|eukprot:XP_955466.1 hypothetical protein TA18205 [Theileria annulata]
MKEKIIDTINSRDTSEEKHVHFEESEEEESQTASSESGEAKYEEFQRKKKRSSTLPNPNVKMNLSGEVQLILHNKGTCKPCAFVYNKKKTCRNGLSCGFCHHEDHALCTLKRWKKQQKLASFVRILIFQFKFSIIFCKINYRINKMSENSVENEPGDERFKLKARFRKKKEKTFEKDERFNKVFKEDVKLKSGPKIDPFGRPLDHTSVKEIYSSSDEEDLEEGLEPVTTEEKEPIEYGEESDRIAVIGCDWDNITADDLFVLFETIYRSINNNNFVTAVKRAAIYLSDIGEKKISEENISGPSIENSTETRDEEGFNLYNFMMMKLDKKHLESTKKNVQILYIVIRYYYGVVEFNSVEKAKILYDELDGTEVSFAIDGLDLRFVPPNLEFPRKPTTEAFKIPNNYQPPVGSQSALRHSKVECKWDTTPAKRFKTLTKRFTEQELASLDLSEYLASDDSEEGIPDDVPNYKRLLNEVDRESDKDDDENPDEDSEIEEDEEDTDNELDDEHISATVGNFKISFGPNVAIPTEEVVGKPGDYNGKVKKNKFKNKKVVEDHTIEGRHFDMRYLKSKKHQSRVQQPGFQSNFDDERLKKVFQDPKFEIDTTDPNYKKTEFNQKLLELKSKRKVMSENNAQLFLKFLLSGGTPSAAKTLLDQISVEEMVFQLVSCPSESFIPYTSDPEEDSTTTEALDEKYVGNLIIRTLDLLLDKRVYESIFNNQQIMELLSQGISEYNYYAKRLISKHIRKYLENGGKNDNVYRVVWNLLLDREYIVFEDSANAICSIVSRSGEEDFLNQDRLALLLRCLSGEMEVKEIDKVTMELRVLEFCTMLGKASQYCFKLLRDNQVYDHIFKLYMNEDVLVKLNCLEILDSMVPLIKKLDFESKPSRDFMKEAVELFSKKDLDVESDLVAGPLLRFFSTIVLMDNVLKGDEIVLFSHCVADNILNSTKKNIQYYSSLACFGSLFIRGYLTEEVSQKFLEIVNNCTNEDVLYSCLESLQFVSQAGDSSKSKFVLEASACIVAVVSRFPFSEVREACFCYLMNSLDYDGVTELLIKSENDSRLLSAQENNYETTLTKRKLIKKFLHSVEQLYKPESCPISDSTVRLLKSV